MGGERAGGVAESSALGERNVAGGIPARGVDTVSFTLPFNAACANLEFSTGVGGSTGERLSSSSDDRLLGVTGPLELDTHSPSSSSSELDDIVKSTLALTGRCVELDTVLVMGASLDAIR